MCIFRQPDATWSMALKIWYPKIRCWKNHPFSFSEKPPWWTRLMSSIVFNGRSVTSRVLFFFTQKKLSEFTNQTISPNMIYVWGPQQSVVLSISSAICAESETWIKAIPAIYKKNVENPWKPQSKPMENPWKKHGFPFGKGSTSGCSHCRLSITCSFVYVWINGMKVAT